MMRLLPVAILLARKGLVRGSDPRRTLPMTHRARRAPARRPERRG